MDGGFDNNYRNLLQHFTLVCPETEYDPESGD